MRSYDELKHVLKSYGEALITLDKYKEYCDLKDYYSYTSYKEQLSLIQSFENLIKDIAKEFTKE